MVRKLAQTQLNSELFLQFLEKATVKDTFIVGILPKDLVSSLEIKTRLILISGYTILKQKSKHSNITAELLRRTQEILDHGEAIKEQRIVYKRHIGLFVSLKEPDGKDPTKYLELVVKATKDGDEIYLQTLHTTSTARYLKQRSRGLLVRVSNYTIKQ